MKTIKEKEKVDHARDQAKAQLESIIEMVDKIEAANDKRGTPAQSYDEAVEEIQESPLSVLVRGGWHEPGKEDTAEEFEILLCTGGPAVRILGELDEHKQPTRAWIEYQDWGTRWTEYAPSMIHADNEKLLTYCQQFYFGE